MRHTRLGYLLPALLMSTSVGASAQPSGRPSPEQIARMRMVGSIRANIGNSGLRRFLSESASLGELENRAASYRIVEQVERSRVAGLQGRIAAIEATLQNPTLPDAERAQLESVVADTRAELAAVPEYRVEYHSSTAHAGSLTELGFVGERPVFLYAKGRLVHRTDPNEYLRVLAERLDLATAMFPSNSWFVMPGVTVSRTDVDVLPFEGTSGITSFGLRLDVGAVFGDHWAAGLHTNHTWDRASVRVIRPGPEPIPIGSEPRTQTTAVKLEFMGHYDGSNIAFLPRALRLAPQLGAYVLRTTYAQVTNTLGETNTGLFGDSDVLALLAAGVALDFDTGTRFVPDAYLGIDRELPSVMTDVISDRTGIVLTGGLTYVVARSSRAVVTYTYARSTGGWRRSGEIDLVLVLDF
jgi:hypothetical protein